MPADIWKDREVAKAFLDERSLLIPDRPRQLEVILRVVGFHCPQPQSILDLGSGDAILLATLMETYPECQRSCCRFFTADVRAGTPAVRHVRAASQDPGSRFTEPSMERIAGWTFQRHRIRACYSPPERTNENEPCTGKSTICCRQAAFS